MFGFGAWGGGAGRRGIEASAVEIRYSGAAGVGHGGGAAASVGWESEEVGCGGVPWIREGRRRGATRMRWCGIVTEGGAGKATTD